jgi:hypothetical protein
MQSNDLLRSSTSSFPNDIQSQLNMLYALTQQSSDSKIKRVKYVIFVLII